MVANKTLTEVQWEAAGEVLSHVERRLMWYIGDWLLAGETKGYIERGKLEEICEQFGLVYSTANSAAVVCRAIEFVRRRTNLTFKHHAEVANRPDAEVLLEAAEENEWTVQDLRTEKRRISKEAARIGLHSGGNGSATVSGTGSTWENSSSLLVGDGGTGQLTVSSGGLVTNDGGKIGNRAGSIGTVSVGGRGSTWTNSQNLVIGGTDVFEGGTGTLQVNPGGTVTVVGTIRIWADGTLQLDDGTIVADEIDHTHGGTFNFATGRLTVRLFQGDLTNQGGTLAPGTSLGSTSSYTNGANSTIPEPSSVVLLLLGLGCVMLRCCSRP